jgi:hypothetical protein
VRIRPHFQTVVVAVITAVVMAAVPAVAHVTESWKHLRNKHVRPFTDNRYFRRSTLQLPGTINSAGNPVDWTKLKGVPAPFADGTDDTGGTASDLDCPGCVETSDLAPDAVTSAKILDGEVVVADLAFDPATQGELDALGTPGTINTVGNPVDWTKLKGVPAAFADGIDADSGGDITAVNAGTGLTDGGDSGAVTLGVDFGSGTNQAARGDHLHDGRYYTETELQTSGSASVHWDNLTSVPAGFADGVDDTSGTASDLVCSGCVGTSDLAPDAVTSAKIADEPAVGSGAYTLGTITITADTKATASVTFPSGGFAVVMSQAQFNRGALSITNYLAVELREGATSLDSWRWDPGDNDGIEDARQSQVSVVPVTSGTHTFDLVIATDADTVSYAKANLVVMFFPTSL